MIPDTRQYPVIILRCIIWVLCICSIIIIFYKKATPIYTEETLSSSYFTTTPLLAPGDVVTQEFVSTWNKLESVDIAFSYDENVTQDAMAFIQILRGSDVIAEQGIAVTACPNCGFLTFTVNEADCERDIFTIRVVNMSELSENTSFSLMSTDKEYLFLDNTSAYQFNGSKSSDRILCRFTYQTGFNYYAAMTFSFWVILIALVMTVKLPEFYGRLSSMSK